MVVPAKRRRIAPNASRRRDSDDGGKFEVEEVIGYKLIQNKLYFYIKWLNYDQSNNTWEPYDNLEHCTVFKAYISEKFLSVEKEIYVTVANMKQELKKKIRATVRQRKAITMHQIHPFDPFEFRCAQVFYQFLPRDEQFTEALREMVFRNHFFQLEIAQRKKMNELLKLINDKEDVPMTIENEEDFEVPPEFKYITENIISDNYKGESKKNVGCECKECTKDSDCCPQKVKDGKFAYKKDNKERAVLRVSSGKIIECGRGCHCSKNCLNRVTQQLKTVPLCLFKTQHRGWGIKATRAIPNNTYINDYVGELLGQQDADARAETAYLFDLNSDEAEGEMLTIDAFEFSNLTRFINHSCSPNCRIWYVNTCKGDVPNQKLCFFSSRSIAKDEELSIDYTGGKQNEVQESDQIKCTCGANGCKGAIY